MEQENTPFNGGLEKTDINRDLGLDTLKITESKSFVVRERKIDYLGALLPDNYKSLDYEEQIKQSIEIALKINKIIGDLKKYDINVSYHLVVGKNKTGELTLFVLTNHINAVRYNEEDTDFLLELKKYIIGLIKYLIDKLANGEIFLSDIVGLRQCVYGTKDGDPKPKLYMVDVDPRFMGNIGDDNFDKMRLDVYLRELIELINKNADKVYLKEPLKDLFSFYNNNHDKFIGISDTSRSWLESLREKV